MRPFPAVDVRDIRVAASADPRRLIVRDVSFSVAPGGSLAIAGESGSGKTALVHTLFGYMREGLSAHAGTIAFRVADTTAGTPNIPDSRLPIAQPGLFAPVRGRVVAIIPQSPYAMLDPIMTVGRQLLEVVEDNPAGRESVIATLRNVGFTDPLAILQRFPHQLSGGQRQRIAISMALLLSPHVMVLDEATTDLDVVTQKTILLLIKRLQAARRFALIAVSHDLRVLSELCDDLMILYGGRAVEVGPFSQLLAHPRHPYTARLVERFVQGPLSGRPRSPYAGDAGDAERACVYMRHCDLAQQKCRDEPPLTDVGLGPSNAATSPNAGESLGRASRCWFPNLVEATAPAAVSAGAALPPPSTDEPILSLTAGSASHREPGLVTRRRVTVVHEVSLELKRGECLALVGESGSGKSTLARVIVGLHALDQGTLLYQSRPLAPKATQRPVAIRKDIQIIFQNPETAFNPMARVGDVLRRRLALFEGTTRKEAPARLAALLAEVGLQPYHLDRRPPQLSGGEKQRLAIARALIGDPKVLVCDEIVSSLDVETQARILQLLIRLQTDRGLSTLFISHDMNVVGALAHRIAVLKQGRLVEIGEAGIILAGGEHSYTRELVECAFAGNPKNAELAVSLDHGA